MNNLKKYNLIFVSFFALLSFGQQIDPKLISELSQDQINQVREIYSTNNINEEIEVPIVVEDSQEIENIVDSNMLKDQKYGYGFFSSVPNSLSSVGDIPLPNDYKISLKDQLTIILSGSKDSIFDVSVKLDGTILFPELGHVSVVNKTFGEVKDILTSLVERSYIGVDIDVSLKNLSAKKITIVGAVKKPGIYLVNPFSTITSALSYSGGISEIGTLRNIKLIRNNGDIYSFDLYELLIFGDRSNDLTIEAGDTILIDAAKQFVKLTGSVRRPAIYEILESESLTDAINFGLGFLENANQENVAVQFLEPPLLIEKSTSDMNISLNNAVSINVYSLVSEPELNINVIGAVDEPGFYNINKFKTLENLINNLKFIDVYPWLAVLEQFDDATLTKSVILFNLKDPNTYKDIKLLPNSKIYFANIDLERWNPPEDAIKLIDQYSLDINFGEQNFILPVYGKFNVRSFINYLGLDLRNVEEKAIYVSPLDDLVIEENFNNMLYEAKKFHSVTLKSAVNNVIKITITGALDYPGTYSLNSKASIQDLYEIIGNFKDDAFYEGIIYKKQSIKQSQLVTIEEAKNQLNEAFLFNLQKTDNAIDPGLIDALSRSINEDSLGRVAGMYAPNSTGAINTLLSDGDSLFIPQYPNFINVFGEVLNQKSFTYEKDLTARDAIILAGGAKQSADMKKIYILRSDGSAIKVKKNIFSGNYKLQPGDSVIVPRKIEITNPISTALVPITQILSDLAFSAAAIDNLTND